jgi:hypothetical protein
MPKPNRLDVARTTMELSPATKEGVAEALGVEVGATQFEKAFGNAAEKGLLEQQGAGTGGATLWTVSKKGKRRLAQADSG